MRTLLSLPAGRVAFSKMPSELSTLSALPTRCLPEKTCQLNHLLLRSLLAINPCYNSLTVKRLIKNYTTDIPVSQTILEIQTILVKNGAEGIDMEYRNGTLKDIFFKIRVNNKELPFRLPAKAEKVYQALWGERQEWEHTRYGDGWRQQSERIAWRICKTWLEAQITLINLEQAKIEEVFLPYLILPGNKTLYETMEHNQFLLPDTTKR
jgi:hypothetical protein